MANQSNEMMDAIRKGDLDKVKEIVNSFGLNHCEDWDGGYVLLKMSTKMSNKEITSFLLKKGSKVNSEKYLKDQTPLHSAVANGNKEIVEMLLNSSANIGALNSDDDTPFHLAIIGRNLDIFKLLAHHEEPLGVYSGIKKRLLFYAIVQGCADIVSFFLNAGANIDDVDEKGHSVLFTAVNQKDIEIIKKVLSFKPNLENEHNKKSFRLALTSDYSDIDNLIIKILIENGFGFDVNDIHDKELVKNAITWDSVQLTEQLLKCGADASELLLSAAEFPNEEIIELLLHHGANPNIPNSPDEDFGPGGNILHVIIEVLVHNVYNIDDYLKIIETLLRFGSRTDFKDTEGKTPLHIAAECSEGSIIELLLKYTTSTCYPLNNYGLPPIRLLENNELVSLFLDHDLTFDNNKSSIIMDLFHNYRNSSDSLGRQALKQHIIKAKHVGYDIRPSPSYESNDELDEEFCSLYESSCEEEVKILKQKNIGNSNVIYYNLMKKTSLQVANLLRNEEVASALERDDHRDLFPVYARAIDAQYYRGKLRKQMLDKVSEKCHHLFSGLSLDCAQMVLDYLDHEDLRVSDYDDVSSVESPHFWTLVRIQSTRCWWCRFVEEIIPMQRMSHKLIRVSLEIRDYYPNIRIYCMIICVDH
ncbi:hypothetical protein WDU94_007176 [Cyamophila willieti]